eukprot:GHVU01036942.1.p1 GENE.GHVU01036942.1~~GHVU01036942.1.p1  ORF type:complete len:263 (+),score=29.87 GHVU01036942.1:1024-1812(+)
MSGWSSAPRSGNLPAPASSPSWPSTPINCIASAFFARMLLGLPHVQQQHRERDNDVEDEEEETGEEDKWVPSLSVVCPTDAARTKALKLLRTQPEHNADVGPTLQTFAAPSGRWVSLTMPPASAGTGTAAGPTGSTTAGSSGTGRDGASRKKARGSDAHPPTAKFVLTVDGFCSCECAEQERTHPTHPPACYGIIHCRTLYWHVIDLLSAVAPAVAPAPLRVRAHSVESIDRGGGYVQVLPLSFAYSLAHSFIHPQTNSPPN